MSLKIKYVDATAEQLSVARKQFNKKNGIHNSKLFDNNLEIDKFEKKYPTYDEKGQLTLVGKAKRITDLQREGLKEDATVDEYLAKSWASFMEKIKQTIDDVEKFF